MFIYYAGIGSRETPLVFLSLFEALGEYLGKQGLVLRSGHAIGADQAFERGCDRVRGKKEIWLPWKRFEGSNSEYVLELQAAYDIAKVYHSRWDRLKPGAQKLQARNSHQVLGLDLNTPVSFIVCWTEGGLSGGGTGQAIRIGSAYNVPIFDCGKYTDVYECHKALKEFLKQFNL